MINLLRAEAVRLLSRRFAAVALLIVLLGIGAWQIQVYFELSPPGATELAQAQASFDESHQDWVDNHLEYEQECLDGGQPANECTIPEPTAQRLPLPRHVQRRRHRLGHADHVRGRTGHVHGRRQLHRGRVQLRLDRQLAHASFPAAGRSSRRS